MNISGVNNVHFGSSGAYEKVKKGEIALSYLPNDEQMEVIYEAIKENNKNQINNQIQILDFMRDSFKILADDTQNYCYKLCDINEAYESAKLNILS